MRAHWDERAGTRATDSIPWPAAPRGVYVSLTDGQGTRACVGSAVPYRGRLVETIRALAVQALQADRRRPPVLRDELERLRVVISFAGTPEPIDDPMEVNPAYEGLLVSSATGSVAFLPGEARTISWALREAHRIGVLRTPGESVRYSKFTVVVLAEVPPQHSLKENSNVSP
jgi:AMMECR1 domain-containing protein